MVSNIVGPRSLKQELLDDIHLQCKKNINDPGGYCNVFYTSREYSLDQLTEHLIPVGLARQAGGSVEQDGKRDHCKVVAEFIVNLGGITIQLYDYKTLINVVSRIRDSDDEDLIFEAHSTPITWHMQITN